MNTIDMKNKIKNGLISKKYLVLSSILVTSLCVGGYYGYTYFETQKSNEKKLEALEKNKKETEANKAKIKEEKQKKIQQQKDAIEKQKQTLQEQQLNRNQTNSEPKNEDKTLNITKNKLVSEVEIKIQTKEMIKESIKNGIKNSSETSEEIVIDKLSEIGHEVSVVKEEMNKNLSVLDDINKENITEMKKQIEIFNKQIDVLSQSIHLINENYLKNNKNVEEPKNFVTSEELKIYFNQSNETINQVLDTKFAEVDGKLDTIHKKNRIAMLNDKINLVKKGEVKKGNYNVEEISKIEFEYIGYDLIVGQNNVKEKVAFITKSNTEKIYTVSMDTEIENKYVVKDLDETYLYIKLLTDNKIYKLKILE